MRHLLQQGAKKLQKGAKEACGGSTESRMGALNLSEATRATEENLVGRGERNRAGGVSREFDDFVSQLMRHTDDDSLAPFLRWKKQV